MNETNESKWLNLSNMDINFKNIIPNEKSKHLLKYSTIDINNTSNTQRVKVNISKKKSRLNQNSKKGLILENKLGCSSPREINQKFQKKNSFAINNERNYTKHSEKRRHSQITKRLRHNKSCEDGININNEESNTNLLYNSMICNKQEKDNFDANIIENKNCNSKKTIEKKNFSSANLTNCKHTTSGKYKILASTLKDKKNISPIIQKNTSKQNLNNNVKLIKKLEDNFKLIEDAIIDKNFEKDIDQDDIILRSKLIEESTTLDIKNDENRIEDSSVESFSSNEIYDQSNKEEIDNLANSSFENLRTDFDIFYTDEYLTGISNKMLKMELQLFLEKILEIQNVYHLKLNDYIKQFITSKHILQNIVSKFKNLNKKKFKLISKYESSQVSNNLNTFIFSYKIKNDSDIININKNEFNLWNNLFMGIKKKNIITKEIFKKIIVDNYDNIKGKFSEVEKLICDKLINKYNNKYEKQTKKIRKNSKKNSQKMQIVTSSPIQPTKSFSFLKTCNNLNKNYINNNNNIVKTLGPPIKHSNSKNIKNKKI
jgi:hypothetical protein